ncbi:MAG: hypothetical protein ACLUAR_02805 [Pilosibacter sp.]
MKITSAYANKLLKGLTDEKSYWEAQEAASALTLPLSARNRSSRNMTTPPFLRR